MTQNAPAPPAHTFQVDLRGLVDLLSQHLYASPRVYVRELLQNGVDAITARREIDPECPSTVRFEATGSSLAITDSGVGLTEPEVHQLLATIGRSSKRDSLETARKEFLGQFGIGLLACFVVAESIRVVSRSARAPGAQPVEWIARDDGSYTVRTVSHDAHPEPGTTVHLVARPGSEHWFEAGTVADLAADFGSLLPYDVRVGSLRITGDATPWGQAHPTPTDRASALSAYCQRSLGFAPLDSIELDLPLVGIRGVAYVLPSQISPTQRGGHRVHLKGMLLTDRAETLLPEWAFFLRCVVDTDALRPTASRESLYEDETLSIARDAIGQRVREWLAHLAVTAPARFRRLLSVHHLGVKAIALHNDDVLETMLPWLPFETTDGEISLDELARRHPTIHFTRTADEFRQVSAIASAQGLAVVNGGYTYDADLVQRLPQVRPGVVVSELDATVVTAHLETVDATDELALAPFLATARARLDALGCDVTVRSFHPPALPALHLDDRAARNERARAEAEASANDLWSGILGSLRDNAPRSTLVLNHVNPLIRRIAATTDPELGGLAVEALYGQALLQARRPLRPVDEALVNRAFAGLLEWATAAPPGPEERHVSEEDAR